VVCTRSLLISTTFHFMNQIGSHSFQFVSVPRSDLVGSRTPNLDWHNYELQFTKSVLQFALKFWWTCLSIKIISYHLSPRHDASSGCGWTHGREASALLNKRSRRADKMSSSTFWTGVCQPHVVLNIVQGLWLPGCCWHRNAALGSIKADKLCDYQLVEKDTVLIWLVQKFYKICYSNLWIFIYL
jgi:hypothetical protein